ncbi:MULTISPECIES: type 1 glutamine amidotransferase [unclassified Modestobacter]|uniref:type 1 glutamine amidotransferase n=1 Tax=unclassified Modestobacter TaxID=2643866 RepID=UPI0022AAB934|nr:MULTISPECIES: type 1 glutamine amidotransferase [unclassified Modestobacter]MCZ2824715.1 type 1 glutamine amidotransferase [Modestobacter sp. VKM Ac-2981]MCZ2854782.1 type 1 glutamine amidotransferase [Modestobacter sp. VKM Ac-2982]
MARLLVVVPSDTDPPTRLGEWLRDAGLELDGRRLSRGEPLPADLTGFDGLLVMGGPQSSLDDEQTSPELVGVRHLLGQAVAADVPTLAICLGAQLLAQVGGGSTRVGADGPEVGATLVAKRDLADADPLFGPLPLSPDVLQWHHDEVDRLPAGATLLASNPRYANQAYRVGDHVYGLQFHIETDPDLVRQWAEGDAVGVAGSGLDVETICARASAVHPDLAEVWAPFAARFADLVRARATSRG